MICWHYKCQERRECHEKMYFYDQSNSILDVKCLDNLIGWMLANAGNAMLGYNLSLFQRHSDAHNATLVPASYCEPS